MAGTKDVPLGLGGSPGTRWRNWTNDVWYQLVSSLRKPCAFCLRRHGRLRPRPWPLPFHPNCECDQLAIPPGGEAPMEFRSPGQLLARLSPACQAELVGAAAMTLRRAGLVSWDDLFGADGEVLDFEDVVRRRGLTYSQLLAAGVDESTAGRAAPAR